MSVMTRPLASVTPMKPTMTTSVTQGSRSRHGELENKIIDINPLRDLVSLPTFVMDLDTSVSRILGLTFIV